MPQSAIHLLLLLVYGVTFIMLIVIPLDPELMIRMLIIGYSLASVRNAVCVKRCISPNYRWFCRLGLEDGIPSLQRLQELTWPLS